MKKYLFIVLLVGIWSCGTPYQPYSIAGGFSETQLDENIFRVRFNGNGYTSGARSSDFCLMRSAELCKNNGFKYFVIIDESRGISKSQFKTPTTTNTTGSATAIGNTVYGNSKSTTTGGQTYNISKPSNENTIICFIDKPQSGVSYNADFLFKSISKKYNVGSSNRKTYPTKVNFKKTDVKPKAPEGWDVD